MSLDASIELLTDAQGARLCSPGVGWFSGTLAQGSLLVPGQCAGVLGTLGLARKLIVPTGCRGVVLSAAPLRMHMPVGFGDVLYEVGALAAGEALLARAESALTDADDQLGLRSPQTGRFYHRSAPGEPSLCEVGRELEIGTPIGLIEVMKTFTQVVYRAERGLPARARIVRVVAPDGGDVHEGKALVIVAAR